MAETYVIGPGVVEAMAAANDEPRSDEQYGGGPPGGHAQFSVTHGRDAMYRWTPEDGVKRLPFGDASTPLRIVEAIDVSDNQPMDLDGYISALKPEHVIVKMYQSVESERRRLHAIAQVQSARANGCTVGGYLWLYAGIHGATQAASALETAERAGVVLPLLWLDCEQYTDGSDPDTTVIHQAVAECNRQGVKAGIYTGEWWWDGRSHPLHGSTEFEHLPLWYAAYGGTPTLDVPDFGGWEMAAAHQYTSTPIDRSIIRSDMAGL